MSFPAPGSLERLLTAVDADTRELAWEDFLRDHSDLIRHVTRGLGGDHDVVMDRYAFVLAALREAEFRRLRQFRNTGCGKFTTWLVAVTRRLCVDEHRRRYGRAQSTTAESWRANRRNLVDLIGVELTPDAVEDAGASAQDEAETQEVMTALADALARLTPAERLLLRLRFEDDLSVPQIARITGRASPFPVYRELEKLLNTLRQALDTLGVEWPQR